MTVRRHLKARSDNVEVKGAIGICWYFRLRWLGPMEKGGACN